MAKFNSTEWDEIRKKFRHSIMADTSLVSLAQNLDTKEWPHKAEDEKPSKYIEFGYDELLMLPEIAGNADKADHLIGILKETLAFDDPFGDMVTEVEKTAAKDNPILKTLARLSIPATYPLSLANFSEGTRVVCASEGVKTIGEFANLGQQMSTRVVLGGDFRNALNALTHGDEEGIGQFLPFRKGSTGLHLAEAIGLVSAGLSRPEQLGLARAYGAKLNPTDTAAAKALTKEQVEKIESGLRINFTATLDWFKDQRPALEKHLADGGTYERYFVVINDPAREAIAVKLTAAAVKVSAKPAAAASSPAEAKKGGLFGRLFGKG
ncbi:hypothetical protein [Opitutus sp. GAS368]|jgi:hypothetical protein|uniref:hypothetical protein n=1 Tax=Opitutus sp. GAS368 TaxID=1882749 RepID=UPI00087DD9D9|nr:hypothetical protein [Opitutus sp. GAS368]SDS54467.1 hypothetical protein SAMN05444173_3212 [Opitutus sp. GAS368]